MAAAGPGDFIYLDPPYDPVSATANFTGYSVQPSGDHRPLRLGRPSDAPDDAKLADTAYQLSARFGQPEQQRLAKAVEAATERGAYVLLNNSDTPFIRSLYPPATGRAPKGLLPPGRYRVHAVAANRAINSDPSKRKGAMELVVTNYGV